MSRRVSTLRVTLCSPRNRDDHLAYAGILTVFYEGVTMYGDIEAFLGSSSTSYAPRSSTHRAREQVVVGLCEVYAASLLNS